MQIEGNNSYQVRRAGERRLRQLLGRPDLQVFALVDEGSQGRAVTGG